VLVANKNQHYLGAWPDAEGMVRVLERLASKVGLEVEHLPEGVRKRQTISHEFVFNHNAETVEFRGQQIEPAGVWISKR